MPREPRILGLAGTLPYPATSLSTLFLAWDLSKELPTGNALYDAIFVSHETAQSLLSVIEPLQLGYGAVIISFIGATHWVRRRRASRSKDRADVAPRRDWNMPKRHLWLDAPASATALVLWRPSSPGPRS